MLYEGVVPVSAAAGSGHSVPDDLFGCPLVHSGKVRDLYSLPDGRLLIVASDRLSAFDVIMNQRVPDKGRILTAMSNYWFESLEPLCSNHVEHSTPQSVAGALGVPVDDLRQADLGGRSVVCRRLEMLPLECIVRGRLTGSAWTEYRQDGTVHGARVRAGLLEGEAFDSPMFTPSTKASSGHDENIDLAAAADLVGADLLDRIASVCLALFSHAAERAAEVGIVLADTKFEFGVGDDGELVLADEAITPDSSRLWDAGDVVAGTTPVGFDKQPVRDYLAATGWNKQPPPPDLPSEVIEATRDRYLAVFRRISGRDIDL